MRQDVFYLAERAAEEDRRLVDKLWDVVVAIKDAEAAALDAGGEKGE